MKHPVKAAIIAFGVLGALVGTASAQSYQDGDDNDQGYGPGYNQAYAPGYAPGPYDPNSAGTYPGYGPPAYGPYDDSYADSDYGYCDPTYGCPDDYYDLPVFSGSVFVDGGWYNGPFFWRDFGGHREFWVHGGWHGGEFRGGHFGPALGRDFFARRGMGSFARGGNFGARGGDFGHQNFARFAPQRSFQQPAFNGFRGGFAGRSSFDAQPQQRSFGGFEGRGGWGGWNHGGGAGGWQGRFQQQAQAPHGGGFGNGGGGFHGGGGGGWSHGGGGGGHGGGDRHH